MEKHYRLQLNSPRTGRGQPYKIVLISIWESGQTKEEIVEYSNSLYEGQKRVDDLNQTLG